MQRGIVVRGRLQGRNIVLTEPIAALEGEVELVVRAVNDTTSAPSDVLDVVNALPPGSRSKADIDEQLRHDRSSWSRG